MNHGEITSVERQKGRQHRYNIFIDHAFAFTVHEEILIKHRLFKGEIIDLEQVESIAKDEETQDAYSKAVRWLGYRQRTEHEIHAYLKQKEYPEPVIIECIKNLASQGYIDDSRFSQLLAQERLLAQGKGKQWIRQELKRKGIVPKVIEETMAEVGESEELAAAVKAARKRWNILSKQEDREVAVRKLYAFLARRGFSLSIVKQAVQQAIPAEDDSEWIDGLEE